MRATAFIRPLLAAIFLLTACNKASEIAYDPASEPAQTIAYLKSFCTAQSVPVTQQIVVRGFVTANDHYGEFFKTLVIEDQSGGISISIDHTALTDDFPIGAEVTVQCNGLVLGDYGGKIQLGTLPEGNNGVGRIPRERISSYIRRTTSSQQPPQAARISITDIAPQHIDTYVRLDGVHFAEQGAWCDTDPETLRPVTTERLIVDAAGQQFPVRTIGTCLYAKEPVPEGTGSLFGIIDYFNGSYSLRITNQKTVFVNAAKSPTAYL